jgi:hypothetical protein
MSQPFSKKDPVMNFDLINYRRNLGYNNFYVFYTLLQSLQYRLIAF